MKIERAFVGMLEERLQEDDLLIQAVLGPRQVGKTTGVKQCLEKLSVPFRYVSADELFHPDLTWLLQEWQQAQLMPKGSVLAIDEIQKIDDWQSVLKDLWDNKNHQQLKVVVLGSSSLAINRGLKETLAGRYEVIPVFHWSSAESRELGIDFETWIVRGGYPGSYRLLKDQPRWQAYIKDSIVENVLNKDVFRLRPLPKPVLFRQFLEIIRAYPCQEISFTKLLGQLQDHGNVELIKGYLEMLEGAFLLRSLEKYSRKEHLKKSSSPKILPLASALCTYPDSVVKWKSPEAYGRLFECAVGGVLARLPGRLHYWRERTDEVDFVYENDATYAIEVKSGRKKRTGGLFAFQKKFADAKAVIITPENFAVFENAPLDFLRACDPSRATQACI